MKRTSLLQVRMSPEERKEFKALAHSKAQTESAMARLLIKEAIEQQQLKKK